MLLNTGIDEISSGYQETCLPLQDFFPDSCLIPDISSGHHVEIQLVTTKIYLNLLTLLVQAFSIHSQLTG